MGELELARLVEELREVRIKLRDRATPWTSNQPSDDDFIRTNELLEKVERLVEYEYFSTHPSATLSELLFAARQAELHPAVMRAMNHAMDFLRVLEVKRARHAQTEVPAGAPGWNFGRKIQFMFLSCALLVALVAVVSVYSRTSSTEFAILRSSAEEAREFRSRANQLEADLHAARDQVARLHSEVAIAANDRRARTTYVATLTSASIEAAYHVQKKLAGDSHDFDEATLRQWALDSAASQLETRLRNTEGIVRVKRLAHRGEFLVTGTAAFSPPPDFFLPFKVPAPSDPNQLWIRAFETDGGPKPNNGSGQKSPDKPDKREEGPGETGKKPGWWLFWEAVTGRPVQNPGQAGYNWLLERIGAMPSLKAGSGTWVAILDTGCLPSPEVISTKTVRVVQEDGRLQPYRSSPAATNQGPFFVFAGITRDGVAPDVSAPYDHGGDYHGTAMTSILAGRHGIIPAANVVVVACLDDYPSVVEGLRWLKEFRPPDNGKVGIVCMAFETRDELTAYASRLIIEDFKKNGVALVASCGEDADQPCPPPASFPEVFGVGALEATEKMWRVWPKTSLRSFPKKPDLWAPGVGIPYLSGVTGEWASATGTSPATALTSGVVARVRVRAGISLDVGAVTTQAQCDVGAGPTPVRVLHCRE